MSLRSKMDYNNDYNKRTYKSYTLRFNKLTEAEIIKYLSEKDTTPYIRALIRADMARVAMNEKFGSPHGAETHAVMPEFPVEIQPPHLVDDLRSGHDDIEKYPYEVMEQMPFFDKYVIAYCSDLDHVRKTITDYCMTTAQVGEIYVCKRFKDSQGNIYGRRIRAEFIKEGR